MRAAGPAIIMLFFIFGVVFVLPARDKKLPPREKFFRGDTAVMKLDGRQVLIVGKRYVDNDGTAHDVWKYQARVPCQDKSYVVVDVYEFELVPASKDK